MMDRLYYPESKKVIHDGDDCSGCEMDKWGIGEGRVPFTSDPENPRKPFAHYKGEE